MDTKITYYTNTTNTTAGLYDSYIGGTWSPTISYSWPNTIYKYQIKCPKCKKMNWLELDKIADCTKCQSTLRAVNKSVDFEVEVEL